MSEILHAKVLVAIAAGDPAKGVLVTELRRRFTNARRKKASLAEADAVLAALTRDGMVAEVARRGDAKGLRLTAAGRTAALGLSFAGGTVSRGKYTGKQVYEAQVALRRELERLAGALAEREAELKAAREELATAPDPETDPAAATAADAPPEASAPATGGPAPIPALAPLAEDLGSRVLAAAREVERDENPHGRLIPVHQLRDVVPSTRLAFDDALWALARAGRGTLHKLNDAARMTEEGRRGAFRHPFTGSLLYFFRAPEERAP